MIIKLHVRKGRTVRPGLADYIVITVPGLDDAKFYSHYNLAYFMIVWLYYRGAFEFVGPLSALIEQRRFKLKEAKKADPFFVMNSSLSHRLDVSCRAICLQHTKLLQESAPATT